MFKRKNRNIEHNPSRRKFLGWMLGSGITLMASPKIIKAVWSQMTPQVDESSQDERAEILRLIATYYEDKKDDSRTAIWHEIRRYGTDDGFDITVPLTQIRYYSEAQKFGYQRVLPVDYPKIKDELVHIKNCLTMVKDKLELRKNQKRNPKKYDVSNALWNGLDSRITLGEEMLKLVPGLVYDYISVIILRAKLSHFENQTPIASINVFKSEIDNLFNEIKRIKA